MTAQGKSLPGAGIPQLAQSSLIPNPERRDLEICVDSSHIWQPKATKECVGSLDVW